MPPETAADLALFATEDMVQTGAYDLYSLAARIPENERDEGTGSVPDVCFFWLFIVTHSKFAMRQEHSREKVTGFRSMTRKFLSGSAGFARRKQNLPGRKRGDSYASS